MKRYRIGVVSYLNTLPFLQGLQSPGIHAQSDLILAHPARCAQLLADGEVDIALCPIGALPGLSDWQLLTDYCIGCDGAVRTVCVYSDIPFAELDTIVLSDESRTSNQLVQILDREYWKRGYVFKDMQDHVPGSHSTGFLHIGDICFEKERVFTYRTDLGQVWKEYSGLPFVFACWISLAPVRTEFVQELNFAFEQAMENRPNMLPPDKAIPGDYLVQNISYNLDDRKKTALKRFLELSEVITREP